jgi:uncharacterized lipoprotein YddW (UPF0748 family)
MKQILIFILLCMASFMSFAQPIREMRAVWLTVNYGLDWPSQPYFYKEDIDFQKLELDNILDRLKKANINLIFFQARIRGDVSYRSNIEPLNESVAKNGAYAEYDALEYAVEACHQRGMECHAWFVVYPLGRAKKGKRPNEAPTVTKNQKLIKTFNGDLYFDPGNPSTNDYLLSLIREITTHYDIDGIHFDYIRYPDSSAKFPDDDTWRRYGRGMSKNDWRRNNINQFVYKAYDLVKSIKQYVQVSSSVLGQYDRLPEVLRGHWTAYNSVYQDPIDWLSKGKHDFIVPMMYNSGDLFFPFVGDWQAQRYERLIMPGLAAYLVGSRESNWGSDVILEQIGFSREKHTAGNAFFRAKSLLDNYAGLFDKIKREYYSKPALLPPLAWLSKLIPDAPQNIYAEGKKEILHLEWDPVLPKKRTESIFYNVYRSEAFPVDLENPENLLSMRLTDNHIDIEIDNSKETAFYYVITAYDRYHNESKPSTPAFFVTGLFEK